MIAGYTYRTENKEILHIINTILLKNGFDQYDLQFYNNYSKKKAGSWASQLIESGSLNPNLYFFRPQPQNSLSPLFARQYEKLKQKPDGQYSGDQYHRIHPLTKAGLDLEHYRWIRRSSEGDIKFEDAIDPEYRGKDFWQTPEWRGRKDIYLRNYNELFKKYKVRHPESPSLQSTPYEIEYKFMILGEEREAAAVVLSIEAWIQEMSISTIKLSRFT